MTEPALRSWTRSESAISSPHQGGVYRSGLDEVLAKDRLRGLDLNQRPLGYEPFPNHHHGQPATNNAS